MATKKTFLKTELALFKHRVQIQFNEPVFFEEGDQLEIHIREDPDGGFIFPEFVCYRVEEETSQ